ncbi:EB module domain-containing protein [Ditylenchus destructor]|nr:EB module domain-containing protein [Ditylenchus destructor]
MYSSSPSAETSNHNVARPGESCQNGELCVGGSICDSGQFVCICAAAHIPLNGVCVLKEVLMRMRPGQPCRVTNECVNGAVCLADSGICQCDELHHEENGLCYSNVAKNKKSASNFFHSIPRNEPKRIAEPCPLPEDFYKCSLPHCFCSKDGRSPPASMPPTSIPQFIVLTFDDAVNGRTMRDYRALFERPQLFNPNGAPIKATFFISHEWTNYNDVQWIADGGHEIASNSISHESLERSNLSRWIAEMDGQRQILASFGNVDEMNIVGMRAPQLGMGADDQFEMMERSGFLYDNTMSVNPGTVPYWPQTLDYRLSWHCENNNCPRNAFPGIWEIPMNQFHGTGFKRSAMIRGALELNANVDEIEEVLRRNFERSYYTNRAPYILSLNADFLQLGGDRGMRALTRFLTSLQNRPDIYFLSLGGLVKWMQDPVPLERMRDFKDSSERSSNPSRFSSYDGAYAKHEIRQCEKPNKCVYATPFLSSGEHQFLTCDPCPSMFPWVDNPLGRII